MRHESDDPTTQRLRVNLDAIGARMEAARARGPHRARAVRLVVVTKSVQPGLFRPLADAGVTDVGENRIRSAAARKPKAPGGLTWHGIGHLQRNKAAAALDIFDVLHAVDSLRLAKRLDALLTGAAAAPRPIYLQVNAAGDPDKHGVAPEEALDFLRAVATLPHLAPIGFMTMGKLGAEDGDLRATFRTLREIRNEGLRLGLGEEPADGLSMGMSDDFEAAIEEGATVVRVGRAVFDGVIKEGVPAASDAAPGPSTSGDRS